MARRTAVVHKAPPPRTARAPWRAPVLRALPAHRAAQGRQIASGWGGTSGAGESVGTMGAAGATDTDCQPAEQTLLAKIRGANACTLDADCEKYAAPCIYRQASNCGGIFYVNQASKGSLDEANAAVVACLNPPGGVCAACAIDISDPVCKNGACVQGSQP